MAPSLHSSSLSISSAMAAAGGAGGSGASGAKTIGDVVGERLLEALSAAEEKLDEDLHRMDKLEEDDLERLRRERLDQMKRAHTEKQKWIQQGHGTYTECHDQKQFFEQLKIEKRAVVHFYRPATRRCEVVDKHLDILARKHMETKFMRIDAEKSPFVAERLKIWALPTIVLIRDGKTDHSIIGFDEMGGKDDFPTETLEKILQHHGVIME